uniref:Uncharacterized protein n=1 Tax=Trichuris muris TaxID=70415 RepID=A0A5S6Q3X0_TRIMR
MDETPVLFDMPSNGTVDRKGVGEIGAETVEKSFRKCSISTPLEGSEDDELWDSGESEGVGSESGSVSAIEELVEEEELSTEADPSTRD